MLKLLLGVDWVANRDKILHMIAQDVFEEKGGRILMVPELISHDTERRLCEAAGDTTSRFAEVLSFTRLARRVSDEVGNAEATCMDNGGRVVAMASATRQLHSKLKAYAAVETRPEFLSGLVDMVDEFKRCCITPQMLMDASQQSSGSLAQKLEELSLILDAYDGVCTRGKSDPRDQMSWLLEELEDSDFAKNHVFYIDGFPDFTRQHMAILEHLICHSPYVVISLNCDQVGSETMAFAKAGDTAKELVRIAKHCGADVQICHVVPRDIATLAVSQRLFEGPMDATVSDQTLRVYQTESVHQECQAVAEQILRLVQSGVRYRDIGVVCADMNVYRSSVNMVFHRCHIPVYVSGTEEIIEKSAITTILSALQAALGGFDFRDVMRYLKSMLSPLDMDVCDAVENYAILWKISGSRWLSDWTSHPVSLGARWTDSDRQKLDQLNIARRLAMDPLAQLRNGFSSAANLGEQVQSLYRFLEQIGFCARLDALASELDNNGDNRSAQILNQLWDILLTALDQMQDVLGKTIWDADTFTHLFKLLLSQYDVGTIPPVLDAVTVGPVSAMRCQQVKHLFVLGATEGNLPGYGGSSGSVLTDQERMTLRQIGVPLTGGAMDGLQAAFSEIYGVFCGAEQSVTVSCSAGQPSFIYRRLCILAKGETIIGELLGAALADPVEAGAYLARYSAEDAAAQLRIEETYDAISKSKEFELGMVSAENIKGLYGSQLKLSASQVDRQAECRLSYFLRYGLRAQERKTAEIDPAEFGNYVHAVLEEMVRTIMQRGGFQTVTLTEAMEIARDCSERYANSHFSELDTDRLLYLFHRNAQELEMIVEELWQELHESAFVPVDFELAFGNGEKMPAINIPNESMEAQLRGFVDRVDLWKDGERNYYRVVDYKTGRKDFDYCDVFNGLGLQMLLYLFALEENGASLLGNNPIPAGVQYFPARVPLVSADRVLSSEEASAEREKVWKRKGLLLRDEAVLQAMESSETPKRLSYTRKKDGTLAGDLADKTQFSMLRKFVFSLLAKMVEQIASGNVDPNPYTRGSSHSACAFCPYGDVCHEQTAEGRRNYKTMSAQCFWDEIGKEMSRNG